MRSSARALVSLDQGLVGALYRVGVGYLIAPAWSYAIGGRRDAGWSLIPFFVGVLLALRVVPALLRKALPFSAAARTIWAERRQMAKRVDSYQWRKLFWIGIGLALFALRSGQRFPALIVLAFACLMAGAVGLMIWQYRVARNQARDVG
jgi:hypothetical protein